MKKQKKKDKRKKKNLLSKICPKCGEKACHYCPPCFGDKGFYTCEDKEINK